MKSKILLLLFCAVVISANAQVFVENFETATVGSNLEGYNGWYLSLNAADQGGVSPVIATNPLIYTNYPGSNVGNVAVLDANVGYETSTLRTSTKRVIFPGNDSLKIPAAGSIYAAFIVNVSSVHESLTVYRDIFTFETSNTSIFLRGRILVKYYPSTNKVAFTISKNSNSATTFDPNSTNTLFMSLDAGVNHLLVLKYEVLSGSSNDIISMYVNPDPTLSEVAQLNVIVNTIDVQSDYSLGGHMRINLRQRGVGAQIGGIRVGRTWSEVVMGQTSGLSNPQSNFHNIYAANKDIVSGVAGQLNVYSLSGSEILSAKTEGKFITQLSSGLYLVRFTDNDGNNSVAKVNIQ